MNHAVYTIEELRNKDDLPLGVDPAHLENYLSESDFKKYFKTTLETYKSYPEWKQSDLKKKGILLLYIYIYV